MQPADTIKQAIGHFVGGSLLQTAIVSAAKKEKLMMTEGRRKVYRQKNRKCFDIDIRILVKRFCIDVKSDLTGKI